MGWKTMKRPCAKQLPIPFSNSLRAISVPRTSLPHSGHLPIGPKGMPGTFQAHFDQLPRATHCHMSATDLATRLLRYSNLAGFFSQALLRSWQISHLVCPRHEPKTRRLSSSSHIFPMMVRSPEVVYVRDWPWWNAWVYLA